MLQGNNNLSGALRLCDLMHQPYEDVLNWLKDKPEAIGEAVAKLCYQEITRSGADHEHH